MDKKETERDVATTTLQVVIKSGNGFDWVYIFDTAGNEICDTSIHGWVDIQQVLDAANVEYEIVEVL